MFKLRRFLKPYKIHLIIGPLFKLFEAILELLIPTLMVSVIDVGVKNSDVEYVTKMGILMLIIATVGVGCAMVCQYTASFASQGFGTGVRDELYEHICSFSFKEIEKFGATSLSNRLINDINVLQQAVAMLIRLVIRAPFICIGSLVMAMILNFKLSIIILISLPLVVLTICIIMSKTVPLYKKVQFNLDKCIKIIKESLSGVRVIRAFSKRKYEQNRFNDINEEYMKTAIKVGKISALLNPITLLIMNVAVIAILWFGGIQIDVGDMTQGEIIALMNYISYMVTALIVVANLVVLFTKAFASASRVNEVFDTQTSMKDGQSENFNFDNEILEFKNVDFVYPQSDVYSLKNISFKLNKGETLGVIGSTGCGKTTLVSLAARFYDATNGEIIFANENIQNYSLQSLKDKISIALQKTELFSMSVKENISLGSSSLDDENVLEALKAAQAMEFVKNMSDDINTHIERGGANISGGQKQRLNIARALAKKPKLLILDDSSSALDYATDYALRQELKKYTQEFGMSVIIVSQRISCVKNCDRILVLDDGENVGLDTHEQLLKNCNVYIEIDKSQNGGEAN